MSTAFIPVPAPSCEPPGLALLETLEVFDLPLIWYGDGGRLVRVSPAARDMLAQLPDADRVLAAVNTAVVQTMARSNGAAEADGSFQTVRAVPSLGSGGSVTIHRPRRPLTGIAAVAVLRVAADPGEFMSRLLTRRELEVARLIASGAPNKEVAARLGISCHTARHHTERVYGKLRVRNRVSLARLVVERST